MGDHPVIARLLRRPRPGQRTTINGQWHTLVACPRCTGAGLLHRPDGLTPEAATTYRTPR